MKTKNLVELIAVISNRKMEAYKLFRKVLLFRKSPFSESKLQNTIFEISNSHFLTGLEKENKKISIKTTIKEILEDNPQIEENVYEEIIE